MTKISKLGNAQIDTMARELQVDDRFWYTGDMANGCTFGTITGRIEDQYGLAYSVKYDDERFEGDNRVCNRLPSFAFHAGPGQRYKTMHQYKAEREEAIKNLMAR